MSKRVIISGGGTGGHIFPAIAIANALKTIDPSTEILFVGAHGRMEMEKVPAAGYPIVGLDIQGFQRKSVVKNLMLPYKLVKSMIKARSILKQFRPHVAVGVGGYASGPLLHAAGQMGVPYLIQEQNSYAGITNKRLGRRASCICVAFSGMEKFFPEEKLLLTGNPVRRASVDVDDKRILASQTFGFSEDKKTILVTGGSLGSGTLNNSMLAGIDKIMQAGVQLIWQTGNYYYQTMLRQLDGKLLEGVKVYEFLNRMDLAYAMADLVISRAGAGTIAELCMVQKPVILVPSPNVAEDHQTKNAMALVQNKAAVLVSDAAAERSLVDTALELIASEDKCAELAQRIGSMALPDADVVIAREVLKIAN